MFEKTVVGLSLAGLALIKLVPKTISVFSGPALEDLLVIHQELRELPVEIGRALPGPEIMDEFPLLGRQIGHAHRPLHVRGAEEIDAAADGSSSAIPEARRGPRCRGTAADTRCPFRSLRPTCDPSRRQTPGCGRPPPPPGPKGRCRPIGSGRPAAARCGPLPGLFFGLLMASPQKSLYSTAVMWFAAIISGPVRKRLPGPSPKTTRDASGKSCPTAAPGAVSCRHHVFLLGVPRIR